MNLINDNIYRMLSIDESAELLGVSERTVRKLVEEGALPSWRPGPATIRIPYWLVIWRVSKDNGMPMEEMVAPVAGAISRIMGDD